jgi:phage terminase large subunit GpA-like protein
MNSPGTSQTEIILEIIQKTVSLVAPPPKLTVSEWADQHRILSREAAAAPGKFRTSKAEFQRGVMDAFSDPLVEEIVWMASSQVGKTEVELNILGFFIDQDPAPILFIQPDIGNAEAFSKDRVAPMIRDNPRLAAKVSEARSRDSDNTILHKKFPGGHLTLAGARSPASLASRPIRIVLCDEIDRYNASAGREGDPVSLAKKRTQTFYNKKIAKVSSPTIKGASPIDDAYEASDKRRYHVPCPHCDHFQVLIWTRVIWEKDRPETAKYKCEKCEQLIDHAKKLWMVRRGKWIAEKPFKGIAGFHINQIYSPWSTWEDLAKEFLATKVNGVTNQDKLKTFLNTALAELWEDKGEAPEWRRIYDRRELYKTVPAGGMFLTAAADVQKNRIEVEVKAWGKGRENWSISHEVLMGDVAQEEVWSQLTNVLGRSWPTAAGGHMPILVMAIDTGYETQRVYDWCRKWPSNRVLPVDGRQELRQPIGSPVLVDIDFNGQRIRRGLKIYPVGTDHIKTELYGWLRLLKPLDGELYPPGFCHYPEYDREWFEQLTGEQLVTRRKGFKLVQVWEKYRDRNEALDLHVYNRAAAAFFGVDRFSDADWQALAPQLVGIEALKPADTTPRPAPPRRPRSGYLSRGRRD